MSQPRRPRAAGFGTALVALLTALVLLAATNGAGAEDTESRPRPPANWSSWQFDQAGSRFNGQESRITPATVGGLDLKWAFGHEKVQGVYLGSQPAVVDGTLYVGGAEGTFHALDARTGAARWTFDVAPVAGAHSATNPDPVRSSPAVEGNTVYFGDNRGYLYALDRRTGALRWSLKLDAHPQAQITSSPLVYNGQVYVGVSSKESGATFDLTYPCCTFRGSVVAVNAYTGQLSWRHWTTPQPQQVGTWPNGAARYEPSGVAVWSSPVVDRETGTIYVGTGQNYTGAAGDTDSVLALDARNGNVRWRSQEVFPDTFTVACGIPGADAYCPSKANGTDHDWDFGASANVFSIGNRRVIGIGQKNGVYHVYDALTGAKVWDRAVVADPSTKGGSSGIQWGTSYDGTRLYVATWFANPGTLYALDPATGAILWQTESPADGCQWGGAAANPELCQRAFTPAVTATRGLVYEGGADGKMRVFSATTGAVLWQYDVVRDFTTVNGVPGHGTALSGGGGAVVADGMLYVQAAYYPQYPSNAGGVLLAFSLP
ncbi:PQQ-binding-like beta-propeller repeat protein [Kitasatospora purpeofusca]|uniref:outer membrane protein assembly factor BamB family protein n=1 Tax=Kitasatospora purpeofusca TaxID=67352 RepID=UPI00386ABA1C